VPTETRIEIYGVKEALKELNKIAPTLRRQITKDYKKVVAPVIKDAQSIVPTLAPMTGMEGGWKTKSGYEMLPASGWTGIKARTMYSARINTRRVKEFRGNLENVGTFSITFKGLINTVFDIAGRKSSGTVNQFSRVGSHGKLVGTVGGPQMIAVLNSRYNRGSRTLWPSFERNRNEVEKQMTQIVEDVMKQVGRNLVSNQGS
jgi:hypothetical protein